MIREFKWWIRHVYTYPWAHHQAKVDRLTNNQNGTVDPRFRWDLTLAWGFLLTVAIGLLGLLGYALYQFETLRQVVGAGVGLILFLVCLGVAFEVARDGPV